MAISRNPSISLSDQHRRLIEGRTRPRGHRRGSGTPRRRALMGRVLRTALATEDLVEIFTEAAGYSPAALAERRRQFERAFEQPRRSGLRRFP